MELTQAIHDRRAVREYRAEPVSQAQLETLIELAIQAPSAMNRQPWSFCVVRDQDLLQHISDQAKAHLTKNGSPGSVTDRFGQMLSNPEFHIFYDAPALILISATEEDSWGRVDCALAAENLMLGATAMGLGSCWIGFAEGWLQTAEGKETIGIPASYTPVAPIIVGHPRRAVPPTSRNQPEIRWVG